MNRPPQPTDHVALGVLGKPRGLRGELWFRSYNDASDAVAPGASVRLTLRDGSTRDAAVASVARHGQELAVHLRGVDGRDAAEALVGASVSMPRAAFPPLAEGEYYHCDLPGLRVVDVTGRAVGEVVRVEAYPTVDALVVATEAGELELPMTDAVLRSLDLAARVATVDLSAFED
jgi:16S rRNA processing protein RimM